MMNSQIRVDSWVTTYPDGDSTTRIRKAILDGNGKPMAKYFLTNYGEWKEVSASMCPPDECYINTSVHEERRLDFTTDNYKG